MFWGKAKKNSNQEPEQVSANEEIALETALSSIAQLIVAIHRISAGFSPSTINDEDERERLEFRLEFLQDEAKRAAKENGLTVPELMGIEINPNMALIVDNGADFTAQDVLVVVTVLEPLIIFGSHTLHQGRVIAERADIINTGATS